jgi:dolichyl-phosphate beta-glucosyltransferase
VTLREAGDVVAGDAGPLPHLSFVIPAFNEEARLPASLERVLEFLGAQPFDSEVVVVNDGSRDRTPDIVRDVAARAPERVSVRLLDHETQRGKGAAIRTGCLDARGDYVFFVDADLATPPEDSLGLLEMLRGGADVAIGSRIQPDGSDMRASQPAQRRFVGRLFTVMRKAVRVLPDIDDTQCPMKGFRRSVAQDVFARQRLRGWIFDAEVLYIARSLGYRIVSVPVTWRHVEGSRLRVRPQQAWEVARDLVRLRFLHRPDRQPAPASETRV